MNIFSVVSTLTHWLRVRTVIERLPRVVLIFETQHDMRMVESAIISEAEIGMTFPSATSPWRPSPPGQVDMEICGVAVTLQTGDIRASSASGRGLPWRG